MDTKLKACGVTRSQFVPTVLTVQFNREPTSNELRWLHDHLRKGIPHRFHVTSATCLDCDFDPTAEYGEHRRPTDDERKAWNCAEDERDWWRNYALELESR
jgi:hypothetical protein